MLLLLAFKRADNPSMIGADPHAGRLHLRPAAGALRLRHPHAPRRTRWLGARGGAGRAAACLWIDLNQNALFGDYRLGLEILVVNGAFTFAGLWLVSRAWFVKA